MIVRTLEPATTSEMSACIWSPGCTVMFEIAMDGPGMISHPAPYDAEPELTSCPRSRR
jgi:hypothetical protein